MKTLTQLKWFILNFHFQFTTLEFRKWYNFGNFLCLKAKAQSVSLCLSLSALYINLCVPLTGQITK